MDSPKSRRYRSYLLRCWLDEPADQPMSPTGRFVVELVSAPLHRWGFELLSDLLVFLQSELGAAAGESEPLRWTCEIRHPGAEESERRGSAPKTPPCGPPPD